MDLPDRIFKFFKKHVFQQIALRAGLKRAVDVLITVVSREHDDARVGKLVSNLCNRIDTTHHRHPQIHECDVGLVLTKKIERLLSVDALRDDFHIGDGVDE